MGILLLCGGSCVGLTSFDCLTWKLKKKNPLKFMNAFPAAVHVTAITAREPSLLHANTGPCRGIV